MNILIMTNGGLGDQIHFSSLIKGLHLKYKNPKITVFCHPELEFIYRYDKNIHHVTSNLNGLSFNIGFNFALRNDIINIFQNVSVKKRIGFVKDDEGKITSSSDLVQELMLIAILKKQSDKSLSEWFCEIAGVKWCQPYFCFKKSNIKYDCDIVIQYGTNIKEKNWIHEYYEFLIEELLESGKKIFLISHKRDESRIYDIKARFENKNLKIMSGENEDLYEVANLLSQSNLLISPDTSVIHIGFAIGIKTIVLSNGYDRGFSFYKNSNFILAKKNKMNDILPSDIITLVKGKKVSI